MRPQPITLDRWTEADGTLAGGLPRGTRQARAGADDSAARCARLTRTVEDEVIPRLVLARRSRSPAPVSSKTATSNTGRPTADQVARLAEMVLHGTQAQASAYVEAVRDSGTPDEALLLDLLSPAARVLGQMWEDDTCTFTDVTIGLGRLGHVMRQLGRTLAGDGQPCIAGPDALLVQMPGEQHGFGLAMLVQFFRRAGWNVRQESLVTSAELIGIVQKHWFAIVGISVSCSDRLDTLAAEIRAVRKCARNRAVGIMVGGPPFLAHPQLAGMVGADATALDARQAVQQAHNLLSRQARQG